MEVPPSSPTPVAEKAEVTVGLACPNCQGRLQIPEGVRIVRCPFCDLRSLVRGERGVLRYQVPRRIEQVEALKRVKQFLGGLDRAPGLARRASFTDLFVVYLPFWSEWSEVGAWVFGKKQVGSGRSRRMEPREARLVGTRNWNQAAADVQEFGVKDISLAGRKLEGFDPEALHEQGMVFEPVSAAGAAWAEASHAIDEDLRAEAKLDQIASAHIYRIGGRRALVYYPLWVARYIFRNRAYQVVLDGADGKVLYGKAPGNIWFRAAALIAGFALGSLLLVDGTALAARVVFSSDDSDSAALLCLPVALGGVIMLAAYRRFRFGEQLEQRVTFRRRRPSPSVLGDQLRAWVEFSEEVTGERRP